MIHSVNTAVTQKNEQTIGMAQFLRYILKVKISDWFIVCQHAYTHAHLYYTHIHLKKQLLVGFQKFSFLDFNFITNMSRSTFSGD